MNQVIINRNLLNKSIYDRILGRMNKIRDRMQTTISYYKTSEQLFKNFYQDGRSIYQQLEEGSRNSNVYSSSRCSQLMRTLDKIKQVMCGLEKCTILNVERLDKFNQQNTIKAHSKLEAETDKFYSNLTEYAEKSLKIQKKINDYNKEVAYVRQSISKYQNFNDPIHFYNPAEFEKCLQKLDEKFKSLQEKESMLVGDVDVTLMDKKYLKNAMEEYKDVIYSVLYSETSCLNSMVNIIVEGCKERVDEESKMLRNSSMSDQLYDIELRNMRGIYQKLISNKNESDSFHNPFPIDREVCQIDPNLKLYQQRCKNVIALRKSYLVSSGEFVNRIRVFVSKMMKSMEKVRKNYSDNVASIIGPSNKMQKFKKDIWKYLGERQIKKFNLSEIIISSQAKASANIFKKLSSNFKDLDNNINQKNSFLQEFQERSSAIVGIHSTIKQQIQHHKVISEQQFEKYETSIKDSFNKLNELFQRVEKEQHHLYNYVFKICQQLVGIYLKQMSIVQYSQIVNDNKQLFENLKKRSEQSQILEIMNNDERYEILYNPFFAQTSSKQKSSACIRAQYSKMRDLLQKKNYIVNIACKYQQRTNSGMCCMARSSGDYVHPRAVSEGKLSNKKELISGTLKVYPECVCFVTKKQFLKAEKMILIIPKNEIKDVDKKTITELSQNSLEITTQIGSIVFHYVHNLTQIHQAIIKSTERQLKIPASNEDLNLSRSRNNSYMIKNNTATEKHTPNTSLEKIKQHKTKNHRKIESGELTVLSPSPSGIIVSADQMELKAEPEVDMDQINKGIKGFKIAKEVRSENEVKRVYEVRIMKLDYSIKQVRNFCFEKELISIRIKWKVECTSNSHKFQLSEKVVIRISPEKINMVVNIKQVDYLENYVESYFKECVSEMNRNIMKRVAQQYNRVCQLTMEEQLEVVDHLQANPKLIVPTLSSNINIEPIVYLDKRNNKKLEFSSSEKQLENISIQRRESTKQVSKPVAQQEVRQPVKPEQEGQTKISLYLLLIPLSIVVFKILKTILNF